MNEYPKMLYRDKERKDYIIVKDREEQLTAQSKGYKEHDGSVIEGEPTQEAEQTSEAEAENETSEVPETEEEEVESFACDKCEYIGKNAQALRMHQTMKHKEK